VLIPYSSSIKCIMLKDTQNFHPLWRGGSVMCVSYRQELSSVTHFHGENEFKEGEFIAQTIIKHIGEGSELSDFAILYRASYQSRFVEQALIRNKLAYVVYGGIRFFERREIKDALSYLRMADSADDLSFKRTINLPSRKLGKVFISNLADLAEAENRSLYDTLKLHIDKPDFNKDGAREYIAIIEGVRKLVSTYTISDLIQYLLDKTKLSEAYRKEGDEERLENIQELVDSIKMYETENAEEEDLGLNRYLQDIALYTNLDQKDSEERVKIMTIHQSKGLEFPIVFVAGMNEGIFPSYKTIKERKKNGLEEERRLAYVAITRAENHLYLTESEGYSVQNRCDKYPSRFIFEIGEKYLIREGVLSKEVEKCASDYIQSVDKMFLGEKIKLEVSQIVEHKIFGVGEILEIDEEVNTAVIKFENSNTPKHLCITRISNYLTDYNEE
ncbi:MAG: 3'-5' exonuclease, partial [Rikenellaceae bacterium]